MTRVALPINKAILELAGAVWHIPTSCAPIPTRAKNLYLVPDFFPIVPNMVVVQEAMERAWSCNQISIATLKGSKRVDLLGRKASPLQLSNFL